MKNVIALVLCIAMPVATFGASSEAMAQNQAIPATNPTASQTATPPSGPVLEDGTPVKLRINRTISSGDAHVGDSVDFEVLEEVKLGNTVLIPKGGTAMATVTEAQAKRRMGRGGKLNINIDYVRLADGERAALRAVKDMKGGGHTGAMTGAIVATSLVFFPAAPLFLFMHGKDITIPKGTEVTAYVNGNLPIDFAKFQPVSTAMQTATAAPASTELDIVSTPAGADIEIDGNFVGDTPSVTTVSAGEHTVTVKMTGYSPWERKMKTNGGKVNLSAVLEKMAAQQ